MQVKNRRKDTGCCSLPFLRSTMVVFNVIFWVRCRLSVASVVISRLSVPLWVVVVVVVVCVCVCVCVCVRACVRAYARAHMCVCTCLLK